MSFERGIRTWVARWIRTAPQSLPSGSATTEPILTRHFTAQPYSLLLTSSTSDGILRNMILNEGGSRAQSKTH
jgi:hypothetical protein